LKYPKTEIAERWSLLLENPIFSAEQENTGFREIGALDFWSGQKLRALLGRTPLGNCNGPQSSSTNCPVIWKFSSILGHRASLDFLVNGVEPFSLQKH